ncbi:EAL domain-containing protein [Thauera terpenica]|nr:EAL domain-containing protein [Thauera terpenica]
MLRPLTAFLLATMLMLGMPTAMAAQPLQIGLYESPPKIFTDASGAPAGIFIELLREIAQAQDWELSFTPCDWKTCLALLEAGKIDLMPDVAYTNERNERFSFHRTAALHSWSQLYRRADMRVDSLLDLEGKSIAVLSSGVQTEVLERMLAGFNIQAGLVETNSFESAFQLVAAEGADLVAANHFFGTYKAADYGLTATPVVFHPASLFFAAPHARHAEVLAAIDQHLESWLKDDRSPYYQVLRNWNLPQRNAPLSTAVLTVLAGLSLTGLLLAGNVWWLRRRIRFATAELRVSNSSLTAMLKAVPDLMFELDQHGRYLSVHTSRDDMLSAPREVLKGALVDEVLSPAAAQTVRQAIETALRDGHSHGQLIEAEVKHERRWFELSAARKDGSQDQTPGVIMLSRDVTERIAAQQRIQQLAENDQLTGLPNRSSLYHLFQQAAALSARHSQSLAVLFMDLDHFKHINDSLGHDFGDRLLIQVVQRIRECLRESDTACRMGGDEFVLVLPETDAAGAMRAATRIHEQMQAVFKLGEHQVGIGTSLGIAMYPADGQDINTLLRKSDAAMYRAKEEGRNGFRFFTDEMQARTDRALALFTALGFALERGQVALHYQAIVRVSDQTVVGAEALVRWTHPVLGKVSPAEFIPIAESGGQILRLGDWVMEQAVKQAGLWRQAGRELVVAVNVSALQFRHPDFVSRLEQLLSTHNLPARYLELEVTESLTMGDPQAAIATMQQLRTLGVSLAIDDFGTGYSSMNYLRRLGFNKVKIDQSFVHDIGADPDDEVIISAIIQLGQSLGMVTLAEGVESATQRDFLATRGCQLMQGWLVSPACPAQDFEAFLNTAPR